MSLLGLEVIACNSRLLVNLPAHSETVVHANTVVVRYHMRAVFSALCTLNS